MTELIVAISVAVILLSLLLFAASEGSRESDSLLDDGGDDRRVYPGSEFSAELVYRLFSIEDWRFINNLESPSLLRLYREQRRKIALHWVREISRELSRAIRTHAVAASRSANLKVGTELQVFVRYAALRTLCGMLIFSMGFVDLHILLTTAIRANELAADFLTGAPEMGAQSRPTASSPTLGAM